jgi:hypothetical protein
VTVDGSQARHFPHALALLPDPVLVVRDGAEGGRLQIFATPDAIAMASMSAARVGWMVAVARAIVRRSHTCERPQRGRVRGKSLRRLSRFRTAVWKGPVNRSDREAGGWRDRQ